MPRPGRAGSRGRDAFVSGSFVHSSALKGVLYQSEYSSAGGY